MAQPHAVDSPSGSSPDATDAPSLYSEAVKELVALGAAVAASCEGCFRYHYGVARKLGVSSADIASAVATARSVQETPARAVRELAEKYLSGAYDHLEPARSCSDRAPPQAGRLADPPAQPGPAAARSGQPCGCSDA